MPDEHGNEAQPQTTIQALGKLPSAEFLRCLARRPAGVYGEETARLSLSRYNRDMVQGVNLMEQEVLKLDQLPAEEVVRLWMPQDDPDDEVTVRLPQLWPERARP